MREAAKRSLGQRLYDEQIMAGIALHRGKVAEMQTGEGKTLAAVAPVFVNALSGHGVHVLTVNDYLARRDAAWMGPVYQLLGITVGCIQEGMSIEERREAYACDVTYVTAKEAGFDLLRDGLCLEPEDQVHRPFNFVIVDEADSILIDEARVPLVIAGDTDETAIGFGPAQSIAPGARAGEGLRYRRVLAKYQPHRKRFAPGRGAAGVRQSLSARKPRRACRSSERAPRRGASPA